MRARAAGQQVPIGGCLTADSVATLQDTGERGICRIPATASGRPRVTAGDVSLGADTGAGMTRGEDFRRGRVAA
jgi:hypothetical protein